MVQRFKLVNLDKRQTTELYTLRESLYRTIIIHQHLAGHSYRLLSAADFIDDRQKWLEDLAHRSFAELPRHRGGRCDQARCELLRKLPLEIVAMCIAAAETLHEQASFALTCQTMWDIARPDLLRALRAGASWEGDRIMVLGGDMTADDMPPGVLNEEERAVVRDLQEKSREGDPPSAGAFLAQLGTSDARFDLGEVRTGLASRYRLPPRHMQRWWFNYYREDEMWLVLAEYDARAVETRGAVLRNLTTHEYVRGDALLAAREAAGRPDGDSPLHEWGFGDILLMRICWSPSSAPELGERHNPRNVWAGHRFDFAREDALPRDAEGKVLPPWKDVSEEYMKELSEWSIQYDIVDRY